MTDLAAIKRALSIPDVAQRLGINVPRGKGDATCPRHNGQSLRLHEDYFYCWGGCADHGGKGDIFNLVMFIEGVDFATALRRCAEWAGIKLEISPAEERRIEQRRKVEDLLGFAADFYARQYTGSPAEAYAEARKINHPDARLGYASADSWTALTSALTEAGVALPDAEAAGLIKPSKRGGYHDRFHNRLVLPAYEGGRCVYIQARALDESEPKYINVALDEPPLYHVNGALKSPAPAVTESSTDMLRLACAGIKAVGTYGAQLKEHQRRRLLRFEKVYAAGQNDDAGLKFVDAMALALGERVRVSNPPAAYKGWDEALAAGIEWAPDDALTWVRWKVLQIAPSSDQLAVRKALEPVFQYLASLDDEAAVIAYLGELTKRYGWRRPLAQEYGKQIRELRAARKAAERPDEADVGGEGEAMGETLEPPVFIAPALAEHDGVVYVAQMMAYVASRETKTGSITAPVWQPVILTSDRRRVRPEPLPKGAPDGAITFLDRGKNLALRGPLADAAEGRWSYPGMVAFLNGSAPAVTPHAVYTALLDTVRQFVYHADDSSYTVDVLWIMGTYFHQIFNAFPYLALHGHRGAGKTTLLTLLNALAFNARFLVNASEAALYRSIQSQAPTLLIDEQEGLNSSKAAKENKADLMGILKSGYKKGAQVARQRLDMPGITEYFEVYSPKALAAIEHFEDVLENRAILTFMTEKPAGVTLRDQNEIVNRDAEEFAPLRDQLYLLLMQEAPAVRKLAARVTFDAENRFRELFLPLYTMAALVDISRGDGRRTVYEALNHAAAGKLTLRKERDNLTPDAQLKEALALVVRRALFPEHTDHDGPTVQEDGDILADSLHVRDAFAALTLGKVFDGFETWLGKQVQKMPTLIRFANPRRRWRKVPIGLGEFEQKQLTNYVISRGVYEAE
jgi:DNA primase/energy-coupling factor transporter ATP-binding protein EcfA2